MGGSFVSASGVQLRGAQRGPRLESGAKKAKKASCDIFQFNAQAVEFAPAVHPERRPCPAVAPQSIGLRQQAGGGNEGKAEPLHPHLLGEGAWTSFDDARDCQWDPEETMVVEDDAVEEDLSCASGPACDAAHRARGSGGEASLALAPVLFGSGRNPFEVPAGPASASTNCKQQ